MRFAELPLRGAFVITPERHVDPRGHFARTFCRDEFAVHGLAGDFVQCSTSFNAKRGTLRGMHMQRAPYAEAKLVRCTRGSALDVVLDPVSGRWHGVELSVTSGLAVYVPAGFAHGFQTLEDETELFYQMTERYHPEAAVIIPWDFVDWPIRPPIVSQQDASHVAHA